MVNANESFILRILYSSVWKNVGITKDGVIIAFLDAFNTFMVLWYACLCFLVSVIGQG